jgi:iron complex transport system substrate-binding protein
MRVAAAAALATAAALAACAAPEPQGQGTLRVLSLDGCADQYVLAMAPDAELALSPRADDPDSHMRAAARGRTRVRTTLEAAVGFRPDVAVRQWGGDPRLVAALKARGVPFAFASGYGAAGVEEDHRDAPVLQKPFRQIDLERALAGLVSR